MDEEMHPHFYSSYKTLQDMSTNLRLIMSDTASPLIGGQIPPPPPGFNYLAALKPSLTYALIAAVFTSFLIPILIALLFFSTKESRRHLMFHFNVAALILGIGEGVVFITIQIHDILSPLHPFPQGVHTGWFILSYYSPLLVDSILFLRLVAVYPPSITARRTLLFVLGFPVLCKAARFATISLTTAKWVIASQILGNPVSGGLVVWGKLPYAKVAWILQLVDNMYLSSLFIYRIRRRITPASDALNRGATFAAQLRGLFLISVSNFVFPCFLGLAQLILVFRDPSFSDMEVFLDCTYVVIVNNYVTIIGVVFATVWSIGSRWASAKGISSEHILSTQIGLGAGPSAGMQDWNQPPLLTPLSELHSESSDAESVSPHPEKHPIPLDVPLSLEQRLNMPPFISPAPQPDPIRIPITAVTGSDSPVPTAQ